MKHARWPISSTVIIIDETTLKDTFHMHQLISRFGCISVVLGISAFVLHYVAIERLLDTSPMNIGIVAGIVLVLAGLASITAAYRRTSLSSFRQARILSWIVSIVVGPSLIVMGIVAFVTDGNNRRSPCQLTRAVLFGNSLELQPSHVPCSHETTTSSNLMQIQTTMQLFIGLVGFAIHLTLLSIQGKVVKQMTVNENHPFNRQVTVYPQAMAVDLGETSECLHVIVNSELSDTRYRLCACNMLD
jgi:hypothetical protein